MSNFVSQVYSRKVKSKMQILSDKKVQNVIGEIKHGYEIFAFNKGQFNLIDILVYILSITGCANVDLLMWSINPEAVDILAQLKNKKKIDQLRVVIDYARATHPGYCEKLCDVFGEDAIRVAKNHAKIILVRNKEWDISLRTSMNMNINSRLEFFEISEDKKLADFFSLFFDEWYKTNATGMTFEYESQYHAEQLQKFMGNQKIDFEDFMINGFDNINFIS